MAALKQSENRRRAIMVSARLLCVIGSPIAVVLALLIPVVTQKGLMSWLSADFLLVLAAIALSYTRMHLERATPPLPVDDEHQDQDKHYAGSFNPGELPDDFSTSGHSFGFIFGPPC